MAYPEIVAGLIEVLEGVGGLAAVLDYEPTSIGATPTAYVLLDGAERVSKGGVSAFKYSVLVRVVFNWIDNEQAEREVMQIVNPVAVAIESGASLGGALTHGMASVTRMQAVFVTINSTLYRALDYTISVLEKGARGGTI